MRLSVEGKSLSQSMEVENQMFVGLNSVFL